ncbi:hypothetical protein Tco_1077634, partial [Tanacetum coccineum]
SGLGFNQSHAPEALGYGQDVLHLHVGTQVFRSDMLSCPDKLSSKDQVEAARTAVINQEIKHILKDVLLTKMKISSMARNGYLRKGRKTKPERQNRTRNGKA